MSLRALTEADLMMILAWRNAPAVRASMYSAREITEEEHRNWFARSQSDPAARWFVHCADDGAPRGVVYFTDFRPVNRSSFWGFYAAPDAPPGTGTRLGIDALDEAFGPMALHKLNAEVLGSNRRSLDFHRKLGFQDEGLFRDFHRVDDHFVDVARFGMLASEWSAHRSSLVAGARQRGMVL